MFLEVAEGTLWQYLQFIPSSKYYGAKTQTRPILILFEGFMANIWKRYVRYMLKFENTSLKVIEFFLFTFNVEPNIIYFICIDCIFLAFRKRRKFGFRDWGLIRKVWVTFVDMYWIFTLILRRVEDFFSNYNAIYCALFHSRTKNKGFFQSFHFRI